MTRLEIILETVTELLEDAERAATRSQSRKVGEKRALKYLLTGKRSRYLNRDALRSLAMNLKGSKERKELAKELVSLRKRDPYAAQMQLDKLTGYGWRMSRGAKYDPIHKSDFED
jgi:hypothetical protein